MVWIVRSQFPAETGSPFFDTNFQTSSVIHSASYVTEKWDSFPKRQSRRKMTMHIHFYTMPRFNTTCCYAANPIHLLGMVLKTQRPLYFSHVMYNCFFVSYVRNKISTQSPGLLSSTPKLKSCSCATST
jgi:hypothetical protein